MVRSVKRSRFFAYVSLAGLALLLTLGVHVVRADDLDPQTLLGEWQGTWASATNRGITGPYFITIKKVEGEKVQGRSERPASGKTAESNWNFVGALAGNVMTVKTPDLAMELTVNGKSMTGWSMVRGARFELSLAHK
jgi:hypothetical protein